MGLTNHPELMTEVTYKYSPVLCGVWIVIYLLGYKLAQPCFRQPTSTWNRMPPNRNCTAFRDETRVCRRDDIGLMAAVWRDLASETN